MARALEGGCLCGDVRYRFEGEPLCFYVCHCTDCQTQTGSAFGLSMIVRADDVHVLDGRPKLFHVTLPDGREKRGRFCARCAARLWGEPVRLPQLRTLRPGTFDEAFAYEPWGDIWTASARAWVGRTGGPQFDRQPEDMGVLVRAWQERRSS